MRRAAIAAIAACAAAAAALAPAALQGDAEPPASREFPGLGIAVETVASGLEAPWAIDFAPDGRAFVTERGGRLRVIGEGGLEPEPLLELRVAGAEGGLLGVALHPEFGDNGLVYLYYTYRDGAATYNRVAAYEEGPGGLSGGAAVVDRIPGAPWHDGGRIAFGPDGMLYVATGDAADPALARDAGSLAGKILRVRPDGGVPADNPFPGSLVYSSGHRNVQGLDWHPDSGLLVATEHGPSGERGFAHDEINAVVPGGDYGWPDAVGDEEAAGAMRPALHSGHETWAPSGAAFYDSGLIPAWEGRYMVAALRGEHLGVVEIGPGGEAGARSEALAGEFGRLRAAKAGPDGHLYLLTSNRDGRGSPAPGDDRVLRVVPLGGGAAGGHDAGARDGGAGVPPPLAQLRAGAQPGDVECAAGLELVGRPGPGAPACVRPATAERLEAAGWSRS